MFFRGKNRAPEADADRYLPELRQYVQKHYRPKHAPGAVRKYTSAGSRGDQPRFSTAEEILDEKDTDYNPLYISEALKRMDPMDSPAMRRYYRSWEKKKAVTKSFSSEVTRMVGERFRKASAFYIPAGIDKRTFHKIRTDYLYKPSRTTAMKCCLGLRLNEEEARELMGLAGFSFSPSDPSDLVVLFCIEKGIWDLASVNYLMDSFDLKDLDGCTPE